MQPKSRDKQPATADLDEMDLVERRCLQDAK